MRKALKWFGVLGVLLLAAGGIGWFVYDRFFREEFPVFASDSDHFKYGSIGNDGENGLPWLIWKALPALCPDLLPGPDGYTSLGFVWEAGHSRNDAPIGISRARVGFERAAINCAFCHLTVARTDVNASPIVYPGGPSNIIDVQGYQRFLSNCASDPRFTPDALLRIVETEAPLSFIDRLLYQFLLIPQTQRALLEQKAQTSWTEKRPNWGAGRIDPFNPVKFGMLRLTDDGTIGNSDMKPVWALDAREAIRPNAPLHWDGLNTSIHEVVVSSALGDGARGAKFFASIGRMEQFLRKLRPPASPYTPVEVAVKRGAAVFAENCAECHGKDGKRTLTIIPLAEIGTDRHRTDMWTIKARDAYTNYRDKDYDYGFKSFQKVEGYIAEPLDGIWLTGPYLHNGSVPTLADLLKPAAERPTRFVRGTTVLDRDKIGYLAPPCEPGEKLDAGYCFVASETGNAPAGHDFGTVLAPDDKSDLIAYLKTL